MWPFRSDISRRNQERRAQADRIKARQEMYNNALAGHQHWLTAKQSGLTAGNRLDLSNENLRGITLNGDITDALFVKTDLSFAHFAHVVAAHGVQLRGAQLVRVSMRGVDLTGANLTSEDNIQTNLSKTDCSDSVFDQADLTGVIVDSSTQFVRARFDGTQMAGVDISLPQFAMSREPRDQVEALINAMRTARLDQEQQDYIRSLKQQFNLG